jgi:hypothetical protein
VAELRADDGQHAAKLLAELVAPEVGWSRRPKQ